MCAIFGCLNFDENNIIKKNSEILNPKFLDQRGPDAHKSTFLRNDSIVFVNYRLAIVDRSDRSNQPLTCFENRVTITYNGEIYNYKELKKILVQNNYVFKTDSDTEVVINWYKFKGQESFNDLQGMFSFALWDNFEKKLYLVRDSKGIKPLYYSLTNNQLCFSSSFKSLYHLSFMNKKIDKKSYLLFLLWGHLPGEHTLNENIKFLESGSILIYDCKKKKINISKIKFNSLQTTSENLEDLISSTVLKHTDTQMPISLLLSSGLDSNIINYYLMKKYEKVQTVSKIHNFSIGFKSFTNTYSDEIKILQKLNNTHIKIYDEKEVCDNLNSYFNSMDLPSTDGLNTWLACKFVSENGYKICLSGVGADEIFFGYNYFKNIISYFKFKKLIPISILKKILIFLNFNKHKANSLHLYSKSLEMMYLLQRSIYLLDDFLDKEERNIIFEYLNKYIDKAAINTENVNNNSISIISELDQNFYLKDRILRDSDWASMSHSVELRLPYVDMEFSSGLNKLKINSKVNFNKKYLRTKFINKIPKNILSSKKRGFDVPFYEILKLSNYKIDSELGLTKSWALFTWDSYIESLKVN